MHIYVDVTIPPETAAEVPANHVSKSGVKFPRLCYHSATRVFTVIVPRALNFAKLVITL